MPDPRALESSAARQRDPGLLHYLRAPFAPGPMTALLLLVALYVVASRAELGVVFLPLCGLAGLAAVRAPRWACYGTAGLALCLYTFVFVFSIATGPQDPDSDRNEALEMAAESFLAGRNPWSTPTHLGGPITTGPASVLLAAPIVAAVRRVNLLAFAFYLGAFVFLLAADLSCRNQTFVPLALLVLTGVFGFEHTMRWSLEELYFGMPFLAFAWALVRKNQLVGAGACLALSVLVRASYAFPVLGFLGWYIWGIRDSKRGLPRLAVGAAVGGLACLAPFVLVGGTEFIAHNPFTVAGSMLTEAWPETNILFRLMNHILRAGGPIGAAALKASGAALLLHGVSWLLRSRKLGHPFWHVSLGGFIASLLVVWPNWANDYILMFVLPALMACAWSGCLEKS